MILVLGRKDIDELPVNLRVHICFNADNPSSDIWNRKPSNLILLKDVFWPQEIKDKIFEIFHGIGVKDPMNQKLVEPYAYAFGGKSNKGSYDFSNINWDLLLAYFEIESLRWSCDDEKRIPLEDSVEEKYKKKFSHQEVYEDRENYMKGYR